jgi:hypothetical protein
MRKQVEKPKSYHLQNGCYNCDFKDHLSVAADIYPICTAYQRRFMAESYGICKRWKLYVYMPKNSIK